jgi:hypothetical protein
MRVPIADADCRSDSFRGLNTKFLAAKFLAVKKRTRLLATGWLGLALFTQSALAAISAEADPKLPPVQELTDWKPVSAAFQEGHFAWQKPVLIDSAEVAAKHFAAADLPEVKKKVDFKHQVLLVFAWSGSGQDKLTVIVAESYPEQVSFSYERGRTKDICSHLKLYVLRSNVRWSVK